VEFFQTPKPRTSGASAPSAPKPDPAAPGD
jgi:hypothetical protein